VGWVDPILGPEFDYLDGEEEEELSLWERLFGKKEEDNPDKVFLNPEYDVLDGDTVRTAEERLRVFGIDAPEHGQPFARHSRMLAEELLSGQETRVTPRDVDPFGRTVASLEPGGEDFARRMIEAGLAWDYDRYSKDPEQAAAMEAARAAGKGLWADANPQAPWDFRHPGGAPAGGNPDDVFLSSEWDEIESELDRAGENSAVRALKAGGVGIGAATNYLAGAGARLLEDTTFEAPINALGRLFGERDLTTASAEGREERGAELTAVAAGIRPENTDIRAEFEEGDWGGTARAAGLTFLESLPNMAATAGMALIPAAWAPAAAATTGMVLEGGSHYGEGIESGAADNLAFGKQQAAFNAFAYGAVAGLLEAGGVRGMQAAMDSVAKKYGEGAYKMLAAKMPGIMKAALSEGATEASQAGAQMVFEAGESRGPETVADVLWRGFIEGGLGAAGGGAIGTIGAAANFQTTAAKLAEENEVTGAHLAFEGAAAPIVEPSKASQRIPYQAPPGPEVSPEDIMGSFPVDERQQKLIGPYDRLPSRIEGPMNETLIPEWPDDEASRAIDYMPTSEQMREERGWFGPDDQTWEGPGSEEIAELELELEDLRKRYRMAPTEPIREDILAKAAEIKAQIEAIEADPLGDMVIAGESEEDAKVERIGPEAGPVKWSPVRSNKAHDEAFRKKFGEPEDVSRKKSASRKAFEDFAHSSEENLQILDNFIERDEREPGPVVWKQVHEEPVEKPVHEKPDQDWRVRMREIDRDLDRVNDEDMDDGRTPPEGLENIGGDIDRAYVLERERLNLIHGRVREIAQRLRVLKERGQNKLKLAEPEVHAAHLEAEIKREQAKLALAKPGKKKKIARRLKHLKARLVEAKRASYADLKLKLEQLRSEARDGSVRRREGVTVDEIKAEAEAVKAEMAEIKKAGLSAKADAKLKKTKTPAARAQDEAVLEEMRLEYADLRNEMRELLEEDPEYFEKIQWGDDFKKGRKPYEASDDPRDIANFKEVEAARKAMQEILVDREWEGAPPVDTDGIDKALAQIEAGRKKVEARPKELESELEELRRLYQIASPEDRPAILAASDQTTQIRQNEARRNALRERWKKLHPKDSKGKRKRKRSRGEGNRQLLQRPGMVRQKWSPEPAEFTYKEKDGNVEVYNRKGTLVKTIEKREVSEEVAERPRPVNVPKGKKARELTPEKRRRLEELRVMVPEYEAIVERLKKQGAEEDITGSIEADLVEWKKELAGLEKFVAPSKAALARLPEEHTYEDLGDGFTAAYNSKGKLVRVTKKGEPEAAAEPQQKAKATDESHRIVPRLDERVAEELDEALDSDDDLPAPMVERDPDAVGIMPYSQRVEDIKRNIDSDEFAYQAGKVFSGDQGRPHDTETLHEGREGMVNAELYKVEENSKILDKAVDAYVKAKMLNSSQFRELREKIYDHLTTGDLATAKALGLDPKTPKTLAVVEATQAIRDHKTQIEEKIINSGVFKGTFLEAVKDNLGKHMQRVYAAHHTKDPKLVGQAMGKRSFLQQQLDDKPRWDAMRKWMIENTVLGDRWMKETSGNYSGAVTLDAVANHSQSMHDELIGIADVSMREMLGTARPNKKLGKRKKISQWKAANAVEQQAHKGLKEGQVAKAGDRRVRKVNGKIQVLTEGELPKVMREFYGEIKDPTVSYGIAVKEAMEKIATATFLTEMLLQDRAKAPSKRRIFEKKANVPEGVNPVPIRGDASVNPMVRKKGGPMYTDKDTAEIIKDFERRLMMGQDMNSARQLAKWYMTGARVVKANLTVGNLPTQARNIAAWPSIMMSLGIYDPRRMGDAVKLFAKLSSGTPLSKIEMDDLNKTAEEFYAHNLGNHDIFSVDAALRYQDMTELKIPTAQTKWLSPKGATVKPIKMTWDFLVRAYKAGDEAPKLIIFKVLTERLVEQGVDKKDAMKMAAFEVRNMTPNYDKVPEWLQKLSDVFPLAPFARFPAEASYRNFKNNLKMLRHEMHHAEIMGPMGAKWKQAPDINLTKEQWKGRAIRRMIGITVHNVVGASVLGAIINNGVIPLFKAMGFGDDENEETRKAMFFKGQEFIHRVGPPWYENDLQVMVTHEPGKRGMALSITNLFASADLMRTFVAGMKAVKNKDTDFWDVAKELISPVTARDPMTETLISWLMMNRDQYGKKIMIEGAGKAENFFRGLDYSFSRAGGGLRTIDRVAQGLGVTHGIKPWRYAGLGVRDQKKYNATLEVVALLGARFYEIDYGKSLFFESRGAYESIIATGKKDENGEKVYDQKVIDANVEQLKDLVEKLTTHGGMTAKQINEQLNQSGLKSEWKSLITGGSTGERKLRRRRKVRKRRSRQ
jgi:endonuclease YncB( thermonuclease family)